MFGPMPRDVEPEVGEEAKEPQPEAEPLEHKPPKPAPYRPAEAKLLV